MSEWLARPVVSHKLSVFSLLKMLLGFIFSKEVSRNRLDVRGVSQSRDLKKKRRVQIDLHGQHVEHLWTVPLQTAPGSPVDQGRLSKTLQTDPAQSWT